MRTPTRKRPGLGPAPVRRRFPGLARKTLGQNRPGGGPRESGRHHDGSSMPHPAGIPGLCTGPRACAGARYPVCQAVVMAWIDLDGAVNVRDVGGLPAADGGETVPGRLLRADNLQELSPADVSRLVRDIGVTTVIDLRSAAELAAEGPTPLDAIASVRHVHHPVIPELGSATDVAAEALLLKEEQRAVPVPGRSRLRALPGLPGRPPGPGGRRGPEHRAGRGRGAGPLRRRQGQNGRGGGAGSHRGGRPAGGCGGRLRCVRRAH